MFCAKEVSPIKQAKFNTIFFIIYSFFDFCLMPQNNNMPVNAVCHREKTNALTRRVSGRLYFCRGFKMELSWTNRESCASCSC